MTKIHITKRSLTTKSLQFPFKIITTPSKKISLRTISNGVKYKGNFTSGDYDGYEELYYEEGHRYLGHWKKGLREGEAKMIEADGSIYIGFFNYYTI